MHYLTVVYVWPQIDIICIAWSWLFAPIQEKVNPKAFASSFIWFNKIRYLFHKYVGFWFMVENIRIVDAIMSNHQISVKAFSMKVSFAQTLRFALHWKLLLSILTVLMNNFVFLWYVLSKKAWFQSLGKDKKWCILLRILHTLLLLTDWRTFWLT